MSSGAPKRSSSSGKSGKASSSSSGAKDKDKDGADQTQPIYTKSHDAQVDLLAQALLREYMHKRGYKESLASFDEECPRNADTVSSRKVMGDLMLLSADKQKGIKEQGLETVMEMLCYDRVVKRDQLPRMGAHQAVLAEEMPELFVAPPISVATTPKEKKEKKEKKKDKKKKDGGDDDDGDSKKKKKDKKKAGAKDKKGAAAVSSGFSIDDLLDKETPMSSQSYAPDYVAPPAQGEYASLKKKKAAGADGEAKKKVSISFADDKNGNGGGGAVSRTESSEIRSSAARAYGDDDDDDDSDSSSSSSSSSGGKGSGADGSGSDSDDDGDDYTASLKRLKAEQEESLKAQQLKREGGRAIASWGVDEKKPLTSSSTTPSSASNANDASPPSKRAGSSSSAAGSSTPAHPSPLGELVANSLLAALVGGGLQSGYVKIPNSFMRQGFHFNSEEQCEDLRYGMLQNEGGPCGVLAGIQAFLLRQFINNYFIVTPDVQRSFLVKAFAEVLLMCQPDISKVVVVTVAPDANPQTWPTHSTAGEQKAFLSTQVGIGGRAFKNRNALEEFLSTLVKEVDDANASHSSSGHPHAAADWCRLHGYGVLCFVLSMLLSRGVKAVQKDMDVVQPLIVEHGYCSQEITNLVLTGVASSNVHDGEKSADGVTLKGFMREAMPVGYLSFLETRGLLSVGSRGKQPQAPVWVIYHESHYTCLFMKKDTRSQAEAQLKSSGSSNVDMFFYDQQGGQDEEIRLTLTLDCVPLPMQRKDALVPYLNVIVRTIGDHWENARVNWNGTDPLL